MFLFHSLKVELKFYISNRFKDHALWLEDYLTACSKNNHGKNYSLCEKNPLIYK
jgi:hypothetical protein